LLFYSFIVQRRSAQRYFEKSLETHRTALLEEARSEFQALHSDGETAQALADQLEHRLEQFVLHQDMHSSHAVSKQQVHSWMHHELSRFPTFQDIYKSNAEIARIKEVTSRLSTLLLELRGLYEQVQKFEYSTAESVTQLQRIFASSQSLGAFGEYLVAEQLKFLPPEWIARNVPFPNDTKVEFALRTPIGKLIPIDSKFVATERLKRLDVTYDLKERTELVKKIQLETFVRAKEVLKYRDDHRTIGFCIVAVPDRAFECSHKLQPLLAKQNIALISYSLLVPYSKSTMVVKSCQKVYISHMSKPALDKRNRYADT